MIDVEKWRDVVHVIEEAEALEFPSIALLTFNGNPIYSQYKRALTRYTNKPTKSNEKRLLTSTREYLSFLDLTLPSSFAIARKGIESWELLSIDEYTEGRV